MCWQLDLRLLLGSFALSWIVAELGSCLSVYIRPDFWNIKHLQQPNLIARLLQSVYSFATEIFEIQALA